MLKHFFFWLKALSNFEKDAFCYYVGDAVHTTACHSVIGA